MKKNKILIWMLTGILSLPVITNAQGWNQDKTGIYSVGFGGTEVIAVGNRYIGLAGPGLSFNISGEYKVQRFIGLGFETGLDLFPGPPNEFETPHPRYVSLGFPVSIKANVHILEATGVAIANKLDAYAGINLGGGPGVYLAPAPLGPLGFGFIHVGPQMGIRYWPDHHLAVFAEVGWGATFANAGLTF